MQGRGVRSTADDVGIAPVISIAEFEDARDFRIDFIFPFRVSSGYPGALMCFDADIDRVLENLQLHRRFSRAHVCENWCDRFNSYTRNGFPVVRKALLLAILATLASVS